MYSIDEKADRNMHFRMRYTEGQLLEILLNIDKNLKSAYELKEYFSIFCRQDMDEAARRSLLELIINEFKLSEITEMMEIARTLEDWKEEILDSLQKDIEWAYRRKEQIGKDHIKIGQWIYKLQKI